MPRRAAAPSAPATRPLQSVRARTISSRCFTYEVFRDLACLKKTLRSGQQRLLANSLLADYRVSERRVCAMVMLARTVFCYIDHKRDDGALRQRIREIAETRVRYGFERIQILLRRAGWRDNHKRTYRIYREEGLNLRSKRPRRSKAAAHRQERPVLTGPHQCWSMDFVSDQLSDGRRFRALTLVDNYSRECLEIEVGQSLKGFAVVDVMERIKQVPGVIPKLSIIGLSQLWILSI